MAEAITIDKVYQELKVIEQKMVTKEEMEKLVPLAYKEFYLRPKYIFKYAKKIRSLNDVKRGWKGASAVLAL